MHRPRKRFGQNFLRDQHVIDRIMAAAQIAAGEQVMEIGYFAEISDTEGNLIGLWENLVREQ